MRCHPSKRKPWTPTLRQMSPWEDAGWNKPRYQRWARRAPLHAVLSVCKAEGRRTVVVSLDVSGFGGRTANNRSSFSDLTFTGKQVGVDGIDRMGTYISTKQIERMRRLLGRPFASFNNETPWGVNVER